MCATLKREVSIVQHRLPISPYSDSVIQLSIFAAAMSATSASRRFGTPISASDGLTSLTPYSSWSSDHSTIRCSLTEDAWILRNYRILTISSLPVHSFTHRSLDLAEIVPLFYSPRFMTSAIKTRFILTWSLNQSLVSARPCERRGFEVIWIRPDRGIRFVHIFPLIVIFSIRLWVWS